MHPLRKEEGKFYQRSPTRLVSISRDASAKRRRSQERYLQRHHEAKHRALHLSESGIKNDDEDVLSLLVDTICVYTL